jgi:hypothetical protein
MTSREIDALVAERVLGFRREGRILYSTDKAFRNVFGYVVDLTSEDTRTWNSCNYPDILPHYSTRIEDAWDVLDKLHSRGFGWCIEQAPSMTEATCWLVSESVGPGIHAVEKHAKASVTAASSPMAICLAALRACGVET